MVAINLNAKPRPMATNLPVTNDNSHKVSLPLANAAMYQLLSKQRAIQDDVQQPQHDAVNYTDELLQLVKHMLVTNQDEKSQCDNDSVLDSTIFGMFDLTDKETDEANTHCIEIRRLLRNIGGPLAIKSSLLSCVIAHIESLRGSADQSYVWEAPNRKWLLEDLNNFFADIWQLWMSQSAVQDTLESASSLVAPAAAPDAEVHVQCINKKMSILEIINVDESASPVNTGFLMNPNSTLYQLLSRSDEYTKPTSQQCRELGLQVTALLILCHIVLDELPDCHKLEATTSRIEQILRQCQPGGSTYRDILWCLQTYELSFQHSQMIWSATGFAWLLNKLPYRKQIEIRDWLWKFLAGQKAPKSGLKQLDTFYFSYAV